MASGRGGSSKGYRADQHSDEGNDDGSELNDPRGPRSLKGRADIPKY